MDPIKPIIAKYGHGSRDTGPIVRSNGSWLSLRNIIRQTLLKRETTKRSALFDPIALITPFDMNHVMNG